MNDNLHKAKAAKNDEFYTQLSDIEKELSNYPADTFKNKIIYCPCDVGVDGLDIPKSNFVKYFEMNKERLGYKQLLHTSLQEGYDFHSDYCTRLLNEADIVVTNPPFSLFRDFFKWLMDNDKKFIIVGNMNAISYKEVFPYLRNNKIFVNAPRGVGHAIIMAFLCPDDVVFSDSVKKRTKALLGEEKYSKGNYGCMNAVWFSSICINDHLKALLCTEKYSEEKYPKYDNYDAIEVSKINEIPCNYYGVMGVPITYMYQHNPDQFDIVALRKNPDGTVEPWTVEREREFNDTILGDGNRRSDEQSEGYQSKWQEHLRSNPNTEETPVDICYPYISNRAVGTNNFDLDGKETYRRITIRRRITK